MGLCPTVNEHEINVLCWSSLEALSLSWANTSGHRECEPFRGQKRRIYDVFLAAYGGPTYSRICLPDLWFRCERRLNNPPGSYGGHGFQPSLEQCSFLRLYQWKHPSVLEERETRQISMDPTLEQIRDDLMAQFPGLSIDDISAWISLSRYGSIAYNVMRCPYIHEGRAGTRSHSFALHLSDSQPTYLSSVYSLNLRLGFAPAYIVNLLRVCIESFEADISTQSQLSP